MSNIRANTISDAAGTGPITLTKANAAKAFARYDGASVEVGTSLNVSSLADGGTVGMTTVNMTTAMSNANFVISATCNGTTGSRFAAVQTSVSTNFVTYTWDVSTSATRTELPVGAAAHGDLA